MKLISGKYLVLIFVTALLTRFWQINEYPVSLTIDEVAIGVSARAISQSGRDELGQLMPLAFESVGDYKPPVDVYLTVPSVLLFGLTKFAVRFPVALLGALTAPLMALLLRRLNLSNVASVFGGFWLAISPWHIHYSRASFEAVTSLFFLLLGVYAIVSWTTVKKKKYLIISAISFGLSVWAYHSARVFVPLLFVALFIIFRSRINFKKNLRSVVLFAAIASVFAVPFLYLTLFTPAIRTRAQATSILREQSLSSNLHWGDYESVLQFVFDNDIYKIYRHWLGKYLNYYDLRFLFWGGMEFTPPGYPGVGVLYVADIIIIGFGVVALVKSSNKQLKHLTIFWFLAGPLPASFTMNEQHPLRALVWLPSFLILASLGFESLLKSKKLLIGIYFVALILNVVFAWDVYTKLFPYFKSEHWQYGYEEIVRYACENREYERIFVSESFGSDNQFTSVPHYYLSFYCGGLPTDYTVEDRTSQGVYIKRPLWVVDKDYKNSLFIAAPWDFPIERVEKERIVKTLKFKNGKTSFVFVETGSLK